MWRRGRVGGSPTAAAQEPSSAHHSPGSDSLAARRRGGPQTNREVKSSSELSQAQRKVARLPRAERGEVRDLARSPRLLARSGTLLGRLHTDSRHSDGNTPTPEVEPPGGFSA